MKSKDHLKEVLGNIEQIHESIDLESTIMTSLHKHEALQKQIEKYKTYGIRAVLVSVALILILGILFSLPHTTRSTEFSIIKYISIVVALLVLFVQLESGRTILFSKS